MASPAPASRPSSYPWPCGCDGSHSCPEESRLHDELMLAYQRFQHSGLIYGQEGYHELWQACEDARARYYMHGPEPCCEFHRQMIEDHKAREEAKGGK